MIEWGRKAGGTVSVVQGGSVVAEVRASSFREHADVTIGATPWEFFKRRGSLHGVPEGQTGDMIATRPSVFRQTWDIGAGTQTYRIRPEGFLQTRYRVERDGSPIGDSHKVSFWSNRPTLDVDASVPLEHQVFLLWVAYIMRRRAASAAASSGGGGS